MDAKTRREIGRRRVSPVLPPDHDDCARRARILCTSESEDPSSAVLAGLAGMQPDDGPCLLLGAALANDGRGWIDDRRKGLGGRALVRRRAERDRMVPRWYGPSCRNARTTLTLPPGQHLAVFSPSQGLAILSVHSGKPSDCSTLEAQQAPLIRWISVDFPIPSDRDLPWAEHIIKHLPDLPVLETPKDPSAAECVSSSRPLDILTLTLTISRQFRREQPFMFGSSKPASKARPTLPVPYFPALPQSRSTDTLLFACLHDRLHLFLGGSLRLGSLGLPPSSKTLAGSFLPSSTDTLGLFVLIHNQLQHMTLSIPLDRQLGLLAKAATSLRSFFDHAFRSLDDATGTWEDAKSMGDKWLERQRTNSRGQGGLSYQFLLYHLRFPSPRNLIVLHQPPRLSRRNC
jgi:hypothetical protein